MTLQRFAYTVRASLGCTWDSRELAVEPGILHVDALLFDGTERQLTVLRTPITARRLALAQAGAGAGPVRRTPTLPLHGAPSRGPHALALLLAAALLGAAPALARRRVTARAATW